MLYSIKLLSVSLPHGKGSKLTANGSSSLDICILSSLESRPLLHKEQSIKLKIF